jgi:S-formylglutathione hydrolase FrmB
MRLFAWLVGVLALGLAFLPGQGADIARRKRLHRVNLHLHGTVLDFTHNHGADRRIWSPSLHEPRDLYVYLPPDFDPGHAYPMGIYLHGATQDEQSFLKKEVQLFDEAIAAGRLPPVIIAVPDGSILQRPSFFFCATFFANSLAGNYEDFVMQDIWEFMMQNFPIRPEREAHALVGASMGGSAAFAHAMKYKERVKVVIGFHPALNMRWVDCRHRYRTDFEPACWGWRTHFKPLESMGRKKGVALRFGYLLNPMFGRGPQKIDGLCAINPIELLDAYDIRRGDLDMFVAYGGKDEFNVDAQVESFLYRASERGLEVGVAYDPRGRHDLATGVRLFDEVIDWTAKRVPPAAAKTSSIP